MRTLLDGFGSAENIFTAPKEAFENLGTVKKYFTDEKFKNDILVRAENELKFINEKNIKVTLLSDENYPIRLSQCPDAPILIYSLGDANMCNGKFVSIVGTRKCTAYGRNLTHALVRDLKAMLGDELTIVSGLAHGIDVASHRAALEFDVPTIGVVAHGLDTIYPAANRNVAASMVKKGGAVITEYPTCTQPIAPNFLARNRIVAGLGHALVVVESASRGGALVSAGIANSYGRSVYAFPGRVGDPSSAGCNMLLKTLQAGLIDCAEDLVKAENWDIAHKPKQKELFKDVTEEQRRVIDVLQKGTTHIADIAIELQMNNNILSPLLIDMEMLGLIEGIAGGRYRILNF